MASWCSGRYSTPPPTHNYAEVPQTRFNVPDMSAGGCKSKFGKGDKRGSGGDSVAVDCPLKDSWGVPLSKKTASSRTKYRVKFQTQQGTVSFPEYSGGRESQVFNPTTSDLQAVQAASIGPHHILPTQRKAY